MSATHPTPSMGMHTTTHRLSGKSAGVISIILGAMFPVYVVGAVFMGMGPLGLRNMDEVLITGWAAAPRILVLLVFLVPLFVGMWFGVLACRRDAVSTGQAGIWINGGGLFFTVMATTTGAVLDAVWGGGTTPAWASWVGIGASFVLVAVLVRAAFHAGRSSTAGS